MSKFVGANALAAVGSTGTIMFLIIGFLQGMMVDLLAYGPEIWRR
ncbi:MAG: hypothetical protein ACLSGA_12380 [Ruminococcus sp.]